MTKQLDQAIVKVRALPQDRQDEAVALLTGIVDQDPSANQLDARQIAVVEMRLAEDEPRQALHEDLRSYFQNRTG